MTLTRLESFPFDSRYDGYDDNGYPVYDRAVGAHTMRDVFAHFFSDGVFSDTSYPFRLTKAASGLAVTVNPGVIIINGGWGILPEQTTLTLATGTTAGVIKYAVFARYDNNDEHRTIYLRTDASSAGGAVPEPVITEANVTEYRIGYVTVPSNSTDLSGATVTNEVGTSMCPYAVPLFDIDAAEVLEDLRNDAQAAYDKYYALLQSAVDDTTAGHLQNQIDANRASIASLEENQFTQDDIDAQALRAEMGLGNTLAALPVANGGTGATSAAAALRNLNGWVAGSATDSVNSSWSKVVISPPSGTSITDWTYVKFSVICLRESNDSVHSITSSIMPVAEVESWDWPYTSGYASGTAMYYSYHNASYASASSSAITLERMPSDLAISPNYYFVEFHK